MEALQEKTITKPATIPTGIILLDRRLDGGLPEGSLVCLYADPIAMPEAFLYQFASVVKSYYFNTSRAPAYILRDMRMLGLSTDTVHFVDVYSQYFLNDYGQFIVEDRYRDKEIFDFVDENLSKIQENGEECVIIIDSISFFLQLNVEWGLKEWLLNKLYVFTKETRNLAYIYLIKDLHPTNVVKKVLDLSDVVFDIEASRMGEKIVSKFAIPKLRGKQPITEFFRFYVEEGVQIDTSRDIA
jgi:KaiC/GvpD/RAD55 family RecA-like ATPase